MRNLCKHLLRLMIMWLVLGMCYAQMELLWRGYTYLSMSIVGGLAGLCIGLINQNQFFAKCRMWQQCLTGTLITLVIEYVAGYILNIRLKLGIWDYSNMPLNLNGQICLPYAMLWYLLMPFSIYFDDWLRYKLFGEKKPVGGFLYNYTQLFSGR